MEPIIMIVILFAVMYFMMIRPENKRKKQVQEMRNNLKKGDVVTTIGGIVGKIVFVGEDTIVLETSEDRVRMEFAKWGVSTVGVQTGEKTVKERGKKEEKEEAAAAVPEEPAEAPAAELEKAPENEEAEAPAAEAAEEKK